MQTWIIGIVGTAVTAALIFWIKSAGKKVWDMLVCRNEDHKLMRQLPEVFARHKEEHEGIKLLLEATQKMLLDNKEDNMELQKRQLLESYERAKDRGYWSIYDKGAWLTMYKRYHANDGNSFIEEIAENEIDKIPIK